VGILAAKMVCRLLIPAILVNAGGLLIDILEPMAPFMRLSPKQSPAAGILSICM